MCSSTSSMVKEQIVENSNTVDCAKSDEISPMEGNPLTKTIEGEKPSPKFANSEEFLHGSITKTLEIDDALGMGENPSKETVVLQDPLTEFRKSTDVIVAQVTKTLDIQENVGNVGFETSVLDCCNSVATLEEIPETLQLENPVSDCCEQEGISGGSLKIDDALVAKTVEEIPETMKLENQVSVCCDVGGIVGGSLEIDDAHVAKTLDETAQFANTLKKFTQDGITKVEDVQSGKILQVCNEEEGEKTENVRFNETLGSSSENEDDDYKGMIGVDELIDKSINFGHHGAGGNADIGCSSCEKDFKFEGIAVPVRPYLPKHCDCLQCTYREQFRKHCDCGQCSDGEDDFEEDWRMMGHHPKPYFGPSNHPYFNHPLMTPFDRNIDRLYRRRMEYPMSKREHRLRMRKDPEYRMYHEQMARYRRPYRFEQEAEYSRFDGPSFMNRGLGFMERESRWNSNRSCGLSEPPEQCPVGAGLSNLGNTCFLNAVIQCFTHTVLLVEGLQSLEQEASSHGETEFCVLCAVRHQVENSLAFSGKIISPFNLVENLNHISADFRKYQQEDAHEFLQCLLDKLDSHWSMHEVNAGEVSSSNDSLVKQVFGGRLVSQLRCCKCGRNSDSYEPVNNLSLEIEDVDDLESAFKSFTKVENLQDITCGSCKEKVLAEKQLLLDQAPPVAALHLKRFKSDGISVEKIDRMVKYPLEFDLDPYTNGARNDNEVLKYELYGFVVHVGLSSTLGHYFCYIRTSPDAWYRFDDSKVTKVSESTALDQEAYILFYARKGTPWFSDLLEKWKARLEEKSNASPKSVLNSTNLPSTTSFHPGATLNDCKDSDMTNLALVTYAEPLSCLRLDETEKESPILTQESTEANTSEPVHNEVSVNKAEVNLQVPEGANNCSDEPSTCQKVDTGRTKLETCSLSNVKNLFVGGPKYDDVGVNPCISFEPGSSDIYVDKEEPGAEQVTYQIPLNHLKIQEKAALSVKTRSGKAKRDLERKEAAKYLKSSGMLFDRRRILMATLSKKRRKQSCLTYKHSPKKRVKISPKRLLRTVAAAV